MRGDERERERGVVDILVRYGSYPRQKILRPRFGNRRAAAVGL